eukprot:11228310-Lingulodinium_polyedra.AAC.2
MAKDLTPGLVVGKVSQDQVAAVTANLAKFLNKYNDRPNVKFSVEGSVASKRKRSSKNEADDGDDIGLIVGAKKLRTIENFLLRSTETFWNTIDKHLQSFGPLNLSGWSEPLLQNRLIWVGSTLELGHIPETVRSSTEPTVCVDWTLPLPERAHEALAERLHRDFIRHSAIILNPDKKKSVRKSQEKLEELRNVLAFWFQEPVRDLHEHMLPKADFKELEDLLWGGGAGAHNAQRRQDCTRARAPARICAPLLSGCGPAYLLACPLVYLPTCHRVDKFAHPPSTALPAYLFDPRATYNCGPINQPFD